MSAVETAPTRLSTRDIARIAIFAAIIVALGLLGTIPVGPVPVTAQTLGVMLAGAVLGPKRGALAVLIVMVLVAVGLPVLSGGRGGLGVFVGPTAGYLLGWIPGALLMGAIVHLGQTRVLWWRVIIGGLVGGILAIYAVGIPVQALVMGLPLVDTALASIAFLPGDLIKVAAATIVTLGLWKAYPPVFGFRSRVARDASLAT